MSDFTFNCQYCGQSLAVPEEMFGAAIVCPVCNASIELPQLPICKAQQPEFGNMQEAASALPQNRQKNCSNCKEPLINPDAIFCIKCGTNQETGKKYLLATANLASEDMGMKNSDRHSRLERIRTSHSGFAKKLVWIIVLAMVLYGAYAFLFAHSKVKTQPIPNENLSTQNKNKPAGIRPQVSSEVDTGQLQATPWRSPLLADPEGTKTGLSEADSRPIGQLYAWTPHAGRRILDVGFFPKEDRIVSVGDDSTVAVWSIATGKVLHRIYGPFRSGLLEDEYSSKCGIKMCVALSQDHQTVLFLATDHLVDQDGLKMTYELWDLKTGKMLKSTLPSKASSEQLQRERTQVVTERLEKNYGIHGIQMAAYSSDGRYILMNQKFSQTFIARTEVFSSGHKLNILKMREYYTSLLWDLKENILRWRLPDIESSLIKNGDIIKSRSDYRDVASLAKIPPASFKEPKNKVKILPAPSETEPEAPLLFGNNTLALTTDRETIRVWSLVDKKQLYRFDQHWLDQPQRKANISLSLVSPSGAYAVTADEVGTMRLWRLPSRNANLIQEPNDTRVNSKDGLLRDMAETYILCQDARMIIGNRTLLLIQNNNEQARLDWQKIADCTEREKWRGQLIDCNDPRFQTHEAERIPDGKNAVAYNAAARRNPAEVIVGGGDLRLVNLPALANTRKNFSLPPWIVDKVHFYAGFDSESKALQLRARVTHLMYPKSNMYEERPVPFEQYALADNARTLLFSLSGRRGLFRWDLRTMSPPEMLLPNMLSFLANSDLSVIVAHSDALRLLRRGKKEWSKLTENKLTSFAMSPGGRFVVAVCATDENRSTLHLWDTSSEPASEVTYPQRSLLTRLAFSPDGRCLAAADDQGFVKLWLVNYPAFIK